MNSKTLKNGFSLPEVGLGTWTMGGKLEPDTSRDQEWVAAIQAAYEIGYRHFDCAAMYGDGHAEELLGTAVQEYPREDLIITSKVFKHLLAHDDFIATTKASLKRLEMEYIDLQYIHAPNPDIPLTETIAAMDELVAEGLVRHLGVSNFNLEQLKEAQALSKHPIVANQVQYNLNTREVGEYETCKPIASEILPYCQANDIFLVAYCPIERQLLLEPHPVIDELAAKYEKTRAQIVMNWLIAQDNVVTIPKSEKIDRLQENFETSGWYLDPEDVERLRVEYIPSR